MIFLYHWQNARESLNLSCNFQKYKLPILKNIYIHTSKTLLANTIYLSIQIKGINASNPPWENYQCIMEGACSDSTILDTDIQKIYYCKSYLQVKWISDFCIANGYEVLSTIVDSIHSIWQSFSQNEGIVQQWLYHKTWTIWQNFLKKHICNNKWKLTVELWDWKVKTNDSDRLWPFYYSW